jgi:endonuclease YncB( thermonuclease family)
MTTPTTTAPAFTPVLGPAYEYRAALRRVVDGDTIDFDVDLGFEVHSFSRVRLLGLNTPEIFGPSKPAGLVSMAFVQQWLDNRAGQVLVRSYKAKQKEKYGRWLVEVWSPDGVGGSLNAELLARGLAVPMGYP